MLLQNFRACLSFGLIRQLCSRHMNSYPGAVL
uniref:Uncharacterized protein n=1 Tax=Rhizophora mucronata TaxID=61149 RepID=A0A2P2NJ83_RHIMU